MEAPRLTSGLYFDLLTAVHGDEEHRVRNQYRRGDWFIFRYFEFEMPIGHRGEYSGLGASKMCAK